MQSQTASSTYPTRRSFLAASAGVLAASSLASAQPAPPAAMKSGYAPVNGLKMYYEIHGSGEPLVLIHGGVVGITMFGPNVDALAKTRQVIAVELQGHGHTADIDRPMSVEAMADDIAALIQYLGLKQADVMGYSLGGSVALQTVIRHPQSVRKLVVASARFRRNGMYPEVLAAFDKMNASTGAQMKQSPLSKMYPNVDWEVLFGKIGEMGRKDFDWSKEVKRSVANDAGLRRCGCGTAAAYRGVLQFAGRRTERCRVGWFATVGKRAGDSSGADALQPERGSRACRCGDAVSGYGDAAATLTHNQGTRRRNLLCDRMLPRVPEN